MTASSADSVLAVGHGMESRYHDFNGSIAIETPLQ